MNHTLKILFLGSCAFAGGLVANVVMQQHPANINAEDSKYSPPPPPPALTATSNFPQSDRFESVFRQVSPAVVAIEATKPPAVGKTKPTEESGSGIIVKMDGIRGVVVVTNNHVISGAKPENITIHLADNRVFRATTVWADPESDIAAIKLETDNLPAISLADSDRCRVGQWVLAFGSPFGLNQTVTAGIISAKDRGQVSLGSTIRIKEFLQTDAAINPGSSGGPLVNMDGDVVGINTAIASQNNSNSGVAFSIPANLVKRIVKQLVEKGSISRGYLGVHLSQGMEPADALKLGLEKVQGALIESIYPESPAASAGLKPSDVVLQVDGVVIRNENHLINLISGLPIGQRVHLQIWRDRKIVKMETTVGDWAKAANQLRTQQ
jgi:S1-C subfamily serine protease